MKGRLGTPLWVIPVLAMVMAIGAFAVFASIDHFSTPAEANVKEAGQGLSSNVDLEKLTEPLQTPLQAMDTAVTPVTGTAVNNPLRPGSPATFTFRFTTSAGGGAPLSTGEDVEITFPKEFLVPETIDRNQVTIAANVNAGGADTCAAITTDTISPTEASVEFVGPDRIPEINLTVPDMNAGDNCPGNQGIAGGATVTIIFRQSSGVRNAAEAADDYEITVTTTDDTDAATFIVPVPWQVELSSPDGSRGDTLTLVGYGFNDGQTVTFWRDANGNGTRETSEASPTGLCQGVSSDDFIATCSFTMSNPPFRPRFFATGGSCTIGAASGCNFINAVDSRNNTVNLNLFPVPQARLDLQTFDLRGSVTAQPNTGKPGDTLTIQLRDFPSVATTLNLSGTPITGVSGNTPDATGSANFTIEIPTGTPQGRQELQVVQAGNPTRRTTITIGGASLTLSHDTVLPNQDLTISGSGFTQSTSEICIAEGGITLADVPLQIDDTGDCSSTVLTDPDTPDDPTTGNDPERGIKLSSGGTFTVTVRVEQTDGTIPTALATPGTFELKVIDTEGAQGTLTVDIPERTVEVTPASARPRDIVTIIGRNFIADNPDGLASRVQLTYDGGANCNRSTTADPDVSGNFRETMRIPSGCAIPSTNTIRAELVAGNTTVDTETVTHEIPEALVRIDPVQGSSGSMVTVSGEGFRTFTAVDDIRFGSLSGLGNRSVNTDANGNFSITDLVVPGLDPGIHAVRVDVGTANDPNRVTATTSFEVLEEGFAGAITSDANEVFSDVPTLERAWLFDNTDKEWQFFDTRGEFAEVNSLLQVPSGAPVWLKVTENTQVEINGQPFNLTCVNPGTPEEDCWNLIVFP